MINTIDLFAGCGGLTDGFEATGFYKSLACVEWEKKACDTLANRLEIKYGRKDVKDFVLHFDIQRTKELINGWKNDTIYDTHIGLKKLVGKRKVDLIVGGPPCQAYSIAGRIRDKDGMHNDYRNYLFESYLEVVKEFKPDYFLFENVQGLLSATPDGVSIVEKITEAFKVAGYTISNDLRGQALFDVSEFGIPQVRKRLIIVGVNNKKFKTKSKEIINAFYSEFRKNYLVEKKKTVKDSISDLPAFFPRKKFLKGSSHTGDSENFCNHVPRYNNERDVKIFTLLTKDIENKKFKYLSVESLKQLYYETTGKKTNIHKYHVLKWDKPSNTIPAHLYKDGLRHIHPDSKQSRTITVREAARLQTFDDDFTFNGSIADQFKMIGNAVPPLFAKKLALNFKSIIEKYGK